MPSPSARVPGHSSSGVASSSPNPATCRRGRRSPSPSSSSHRGELCLPPLSRRSAQLAPCQCIATASLDSALRRHTAPPAASSALCLPPPPDPGDSTSPARLLHQHRTCPRAGRRRPRPHLLRPPPLALPLSGGQRHQRRAGGRPSAAPLQAAGPLPTAHCPRSARSSVLATSPPWHPLLLPAAPPRLFPAVGRHRPQLPATPPDSILVAARALLDGSPRYSRSCASPTSVVPTPYLRHHHLL